MIMVITNVFYSGWSRLICKDPNGLYGHLTDCQKYYQCGHGTPYEYTCPPGTLWNDQRKSCDWAHNVICQLQETTTPTATSTTTVTTVDSRLDYMFLG